VSSGGDLRKAGKYIGNSGLAPFYTVDFVLDCDRRQLTIVRPTDGKAAVLTDLPENVAWLPHFHGSDEGVTFSIQMLDPAAVPVRQLADIAAETAARDARVAAAVEQGTYDEDDTDVYYRNTPYPGDQPECEKEQQEEEEDFN